MRAAGVLILVLGACTSTTGGDASPTDHAEPTSTETSTPAEPAIPASPGQPTSAGSSAAPEDVLAAILADAASRAGVAPEALAVTRAEAVVWPDAGLGCPQPGVGYAQVLTPGYWVVVDADGRQLDYRVNRMGGFRLCTLPPGDRQPPARDE